MVPSRRPRIRGLVVLALAAVAVAGAIASSWWTWRSGAEPRVVIRGAVGGELERVVDALQAFAGAGLQLPPAEVTVHPRDRCPIRGLAAGRAYEEWPRHRVVVCSTDARIVVHELAHAWTFQYLGPHQRRSFALMRELPTWHERTHAWEDRAMEHAAEIITWAVLDLDPDEVMVSPRDPESLRLAYAYLLGQAASDPRPHGALRGMVTSQVPAVRLSPDPCRAVSRLDARVADRFVRHEAPDLGTVAGVCWVPAASGTVEPIAIVEVPLAG